MSLFPDLDRQLLAIRTENAAAFDHINKRLNRLMTKIEDTAAAIAANTVAIRNIGTAVGALTEGHETIIAEIQALKDQIAAGAPPDFTAVDAALTDQTVAIGDLGKLVPTA